MKEIFTAPQLSKVIDQALIYQCACPAQVCRAIFELRELYDFQLNCANDSSNDRLVHQAIADATAEAHAAMEKCLEQVLGIEGWDLATLEMPAKLRQTKTPKPV